jgi:nuclear pore complex protein Nup107
MDLSALIADEGSDLLQIFVETKRMNELVDAFAVAGKELLILTANKQGSGSKSKKLRAKGWTPDLWTVKT